MREQVLPAWTKLKEKINELKLSKKDQQLVELIDKFQLEQFFVPRDDWFKTEAERDEFEQRWTDQAKQCSDKLRNAEFDNFLLNQSRFLIYLFCLLIDDWIEKRKAIRYLEWNVSELENWKTTSHHLLFKAKQAIRTGMNHTCFLWEIKEGKLSVNNLMEAPEIRKASAPMTKILTQIGQLDFIDEVYQDD